MSAPLHFPATSSPLYRLDDETDAMALTDQMSARLAQLQALLAMTYGDAGDAFRRMAQSHRDDYLWACYMIAGEVRELGDALLVQRRKEAGPNA
ncbi:MAG: hypothetical protein EKK49_01170 [Rhodocyclaceae bacterium]|nr:MAG: hypothetical protein EKK49_01170 [Rhodocyclaceae bacterium]